MSQNDKIPLAQEQDLIEQESSGQKMKFVS